MSGDRLDQEFWPNPVVEIDPRSLEEFTLVGGNPALLSSESTNGLSFPGRTSFYHLSRFGAQFHTRVDGKNFALSIQSDLKAISCSIFVSWLPDDGTLTYYSDNPSTKMDTDWVRVGLAATGKHVVLSLRRSKRSDERSLVFRLKISLEDALPDVI